MVQRKQSAWVISRMLPRGDGQERQFALGLQRMDPEGVLLPRKKSSENSQFLKITRSYLLKLKLADVNFKIGLHV